MVLRQEFSLPITEPHIECNHPHPKKFLDEKTLCCQDKIRTNIYVCKAPGPPDLAYLAALLSAERLRNGKTI